MNEENGINCKRFPLGALWTNGYLFYTPEDREAFFVDPGGDVHEVIDYMNNNNLTLKAVLLTHGHLDHIAGIEKLIPLVKGEIYISKEDAPMLKRPPAEVQELMGMHCGGAGDFKTVSDGDMLSIGSFKIKVMATPGHTPGSVCYFVSNGDRCAGGQDILAAGDTLFAQSVGRTDLAGGDWNALVRSLEKLAALPDDLRVLPGHGPDTTIGRERKSNPFWP